MAGFFYFPCHDVHQGHSKCPYLHDPQNLDVEEDMEEDAEDEVGDEVEDEEEDEVDAAFIDELEIDSLAYEFLQT